MRKIKTLLYENDIKILYAFNILYKSKILDVIMPIITHFGGPFFTIATPLILMLSKNDYVAKCGKECILSLSTSHICVHFIKKTFLRPRPCWIIKDFARFNSKLKDYSFPSGHTTAAFSTFVTLSIFFPNFSFIFISLAFLVGLSRIYLGVHYPTDVAAGMLIGSVFPILIHILA
ncbi:phosphatase PAP2 family protein [Thermobrachium celere]|uniref:Phosphoesterase, PA-phosphatase related n=1 Tax=Thermobrachium celere DSM 8682 TaxID=941824 RepID=R7RUA8_9CLOT|nr:phosphatase PAP2 family protein [Thermobrachium celere]CDF58915.1 phosphoesterase, PA-phosphatase related [Thermobrachium celere DSM 8682]